MVKKLKYANSVLQEQRGHFVHWSKIYNKALRYILMLAKAGQTAEPNGLTEGTHRQKKTLFKIKIIIPRATPGTSTSNIYKYNTTKREILVFKKSWIILKVTSMKVWLYINYIKSNKHESMIIY